MARLSERALRKRVFRSVPLAMLYYAILIVPWPGVGPAYAVSFRACCDVLFGPLVRSRGGKIEFQPLAVGEAGMDTVARVGKVGVGAVRARLSSRYMGYVPAALLTALVLATPISRRRRITALGCGLLLVHCFVALRVGLWLMRLGADESVALFEFGPFTGKVLSISHHLLVTLPETKFIVPVVLWIVVCFRREDINRLAAPCDAG